MAFLDGLKEFVRVHLNINIQVGVKTVNIVADPGADAVCFNETTGALKINWEKLPEDKIEELKPLIQDAVRKHAALLIENKSKELLEEIKITESSKEDQDFLSFFKGKIPDDDYTALRASLHVKRRFEEGAQKEEINRLKLDIIKRYSRRGRNICDLCSAGYFEGLIKIYEEMQKYPDFSNEAFLEVYNPIVDEGNLTVFVSGGRTEDQVRQEIESKMRRNRQYGIHALYIHGIGRSNIEKINMVIYDLKSEYSTLKIQTSEYQNIISMKLTF
ncbi:MAG: hypothetical protein GX880_00935 [Methanomicrobiales archaeon]|nr:hypothetical protein [Methanomicrobiales archaeon]